MTDLEKYYGDKKKKPYGSGIVESYVNNPTYTAGENATPFLTDKVNQQNDVFKRKAYTLQEAYGDRQSQLEQQRQTALQTADVTHQNLLRYLPTYEKNNGLSGLGVGQSALIRANSQYQQNLATANNDYNTRSDELQKDFYSTLDAYADKRDDNVYGALQEAAERNWALRQEAAGKVKYDLDDYLDKGDVRSAQDTMKSNEDILGSDLYKYYGDKAFGIAQNKEAELTKVADAVKTQKELENAVELVKSAYENGEISKEYHDDMISKLQPKEETAKIDAVSKYREMIKQRKSFSYIMNNLKKWRKDGEISEELYNELSTEMYYPDKRNQYR